MYFTKKKKTENCTNSLDAAMMLTIQYMLWRNIIRSKNTKIYIKIYVKFKLAKFVWHIDEICIKNQQNDLITLKML